MNKTATIIIILAIIVGGYFLLKDNDSKMNDDSMQNQDQMIDENSNTDGSSMNEGENTNNDTSMSDSKVKEIVVTASNFKFSSSEITVNKGDHVKIILKNGEGTHDLFLDGYNLKTKILNKEGQEDSIEFVAETTGTFEFYCTIGSHRAMGMTGNLIVK